MKELFDEMAALLGRKESFIIATIFNQAGSAPRTAGAKMLVKSDGTISGTIGGGRLEAEAIEAARNALINRQPAIYSFLLTGADAAGMDMICGGQGNVLLDFIDGSDETVCAIYKEASFILANSGSGRLITAVSGWQNVADRHFLIKEDGTVVGMQDIGPEIISKLAAVRVSTSIHTEIVGNREFMIESLRSAGTVYIFGAGHVSQQIAPVSLMVGFRTVVLDDRIEFANHNRFPEQTEIVLLESFERLPQLSIDEDGYIVIVTRGHLHDKTILAGALGTNAKYIGMIGSRRKRDKIFEALAEDGFTRSDFERVHSPIGIDIGAETPAELAVSIVGELIRIRAAKN